MSGFFYLCAIVAVGWLVLWTIRDPKQPNWDWWPIDWWPFDTRSEEAAAKEAEQQVSVVSSSRRAVPWRERGRSVKSVRRATNLSRTTRSRPWS
jgi:hypothetical protein